MTALFRKKSKQTSIDEWLDAHGCKSLADVLNLPDYDARDAVLAFCQSKLVLESALFYLDNSRFQQQKSLVEATKMGRMLMDQYIQAEAPLELNLPEASKKSIQKMVHETINKSADQLLATYKKANDEVIKMLEAYWPEFVKSDQAKEMQEAISAKEEAREEAAREAEKAAAKMARPPLKAPPPTDWRLLGASDAEKVMKEKCLQLSSESNTFGTSLESSADPPRLSLDNLTIDSTDSGPRTEEEKRRRTAPVHKSSDLSPRGEERRHRKSKDRERVEKEKDRDAGSSSSGSRDPLPATSSSSAKKDKHSSHSGSSGDKKKSSTGSTEKKTISLADFGNL